MNQNQSSTSGLALKMVTVTALMLVAWNLYTGATIQEIGIPGLFSVKFGPGAREPQPAPSSLSAETWAGTWICRTTDHVMDLSISGRGSSATLRGFYPVAYGNRPANEDYTIKTITSQNASGEYVYYDTSPYVGCRGKSGVFCGNWNMVFASNRLELTRIDSTTSWRGEYKCERK